MTPVYLKAVHIIFVVTWFAGLFYLPRLFVYIIESHQKPEPEKSILLRQLTIMASRLMNIITLPSAAITLGMGVALLWVNPSWLEYGFMHLKLIFVFLLYLYQFSLYRLLKKLKKGIVRYTSQQIRLWNEVSTLLLVAIVFLIVMKNALSMLWGVLGIIGLSIGLLIGIRVYKKIRNE